MKAPQATENDEVTVGPIPRRRPLNSLRDVQRQLATVYWDARRGSLEPATATKLCYILDKLGSIITDGEIERRIAELEARLATQASE